MNRSAPHSGPHAEASRPLPGWPVFFAAGFECSTHRRRSGQRLDFMPPPPTKNLRIWIMCGSESGIRLAREGYAGIGGTQPGHYDFSSVCPSFGRLGPPHPGHLDLCHFGWPDHLTCSNLICFSPGGITAAAILPAGANEPEPAFFVPVNEISYFSWAAGDEGSMYLL